MLRRTPSALVSLPRAVGATAVLICVMLAGCIDSTGGSDEVGARPDAGPTHPEALLLDDELPGLVVEIDFVEGYGPSQVALDALRATLEEVTRKNPIDVVVDEPSPAPDGPRTDERLADFARSVLDHRGEQPFTWQDRGVLHVVYVDGERADGAARGVYLSSHEGTVFLFPDTWAGQAPVVSVPGLPVDGPSETDVERHVLIHELGHALGLVDCGIPMVQDRLDREGPPCHSTNDASVMYVGYHDVTDDPLWWADRETQGPAWRFDEGDLEDIRAFQAQSA